MYYFNLNAKGKQKKQIYNVSLSARELCIAIQLRCLPSFWTYIKKPQHKPYTLVSWTQPPSIATSE